MVDDKKQKNNKKTEHLH